VLYYNQSGGIMTGPYGFQWSPYEAGALNRIAGQRATCGNYNAPCNIGAFLQDLPPRNHVRFVDGANQPRANANVRIYQATGAPGIWYGKTFDNVPDAEYTTDASGWVELPRNPFTSGGAIQHTYGIANGVLIFRVEHLGQVWYRFFEVSELNMQYWQGNIEDAYYTIVLEGTNVGVPAVSEARVFRLGQNFPNPVHASTTIPFSLEHESLVNIRVFDVAGRSVGQVVSRRYDAGPHQVKWEARGVPPGLYVYRLQAGRQVARRRMLIQ
jgi:hypothetical protein